MQITMTKVTIISAMIIVDILIKIYVIRYRHDFASDSVGKSRTGRRLILGNLFKVLEVGEVIQLTAERKKFCK